MGSGSGMDGLQSIDVVARRLGMRASAIRYYEQRGLVAPAAWRSGRRWYGPAEVRKLAMIDFWQSAALMSLDDIGEMMAGPAADRRWDRLVTAQVASLRERIEQLQQACELLEHIHHHHPSSSPDGCPHYEGLLHARLDL
ncbi:MerR family transcriptional regulator [Tsukamurella sp. 8F]|uniref:MerR family transcriptional regulator n=1 Tax=unclassified Tsukamurella TaxID=2633480 RepID=UPI0023B91B2E|nr:MULTISPECIES: MerR family transcriptional regulator [unclassified Tsukamurella]MDF0529057.1 MerR family transcriptional regulator [Tsukamurella sp. 8J]MDF0587430.1 MerR family transcriptional regulator [Tsukamurella sp. 8F]